MGLSDEAEEAVTGSSVEQTAMATTTVTAMQSVCIEVSVGFRMVGCDPAVDVYTGCSCEEEWVFRFVCVVMQ